MTKKQLDFSSGMDGSQESATLVPPAGSSGFGENNAMWIHDESSGIQINAHINTREDLGMYSLRIGKMSVAFPDGRLYLLREHGSNTQADSPAAGGMRFQCVEPFRRWRFEFSGVMQDVTVARSYMTAMPLEPYLVPVTIEIEMEMVAPAWINGALVSGGLGPVTAFMGGERYEQLVRNRGTLTIGHQRHVIDGYGNRTHRFGARELNATASAPRMLGHIWTTAYFPSGFGFGLQSYPKADGSILWAEAHVLRNNQLHAAEIVRAPWLKNYWLRGEKFDLVLKTVDGTFHEFQGETVVNVLSQMLPGATPDEQIPIMQASARYIYGNESVINMLERSLRRSCIETGVGRPE